MRLSGFKIGRIFGIDIVVNATWLVILALVGLSFGDIFRYSIVDGLSVYLFIDVPLENLAGARFPAGIWPWVAGLIAAAVFFACLLAHELAHSYVARRNGVEIKRITLFLFGGVAEMTEDVRSPGTEFKMAIAGPIVTFLFAGIFFLLYYLAGSLDAGPVLVVPLYVLGFVSVAIGIFNMLPGFPMDGGRVLRSFLWKVTGDLRKATRIASIVGQGIGVALGVTGIAFVFAGLSLGGFWFTIIGVFIFFLARSSYRQTLFRMASADTLVRDIMHTDVPLVDPGTPLTTLRNNYFAMYRLPAFPVMRDGDLVGVVTVDGLSRVTPAEWDVLDAGRVAAPVNPNQIVSPDAPLDSVLKRLLSDEKFLLVGEGNTILGLVTREELLRYIEMRLKIPNR